MKKGCLQTLKAIRIVSMLFPPIGLILLWLSPQISNGRKILGTVYLPFYALLHLTAILASLYFCFGIDFVEWRGGYTPVITFSKTFPEYDKLEASRSQHSKLVSAIRSPSPSAPYWTDFRGPKRDGHYDETPILTHWPPTGCRR